MLNVITALLFMLSWYAVYVTRLGCDRVGVGQIRVYSIIFQDWLYLERPQRIISPYPFKKNCHIRVNEQSEQHSMGLLVCALPCWDVFLESLTLLKILFFNVLIVCSDTTFFCKGERTAISAVSAATEVYCEA